MSKNLDWSSDTNIQHQSCSIANCACIKMWEILQQKAMISLSNPKDNNNGFKLEAGYEAKARRCAAIYAQIYLEQLNGKSHLMGRYYWMGLGAFASKTVAAIFDDFIAQLGASADDIIQSLSKKKYNLDNYGISGIHSFAKGNFWLFMDVAVWHFAWNLSPADFEKCHSKRTSENYQHIRKSFDNLPWVKDINQIKYLESTPEIQKAFLTDLKKIEIIFNRYKTNRIAQFTNARTDLFNHLMAIAKQEQWNILQKIVWNDKVVKKGAEMQRIAGIPKAQLILSHEYNPAMPKPARYRHYKVFPTEFSKKISHLPETPISLPPSGTKSEDYESRMKWINLAAEKYHRLMQSEVGRAFLETEIKVIAQWDKSKWNESLFDRVLFKISQDSNDGKGG